MAKNIKVIQCPKCGSTQKTEIKPDYFVCNNCGTEYFLDDNDININHNFNYNNPSGAKIPPKVNPNVVKIFLGIICFVLLLVFFLSGIFISHKKGGSGYVVSQFSSDDDYTLMSESESLFPSGDGATVLCIAGNRWYSAQTNNSKAGFYLIFKDVSTGKEIKSQKLDFPVSEDISMNTDIRNFANGKTYVIIGKKALYEIDGSLSVSNVTQSFFASHSEFSTGIANIEFVYSEDGDGLNIMTNEGKVFYYFPVANKVYTKDEYAEAKEGFDNLLPTAKQKTGFVFSSPSLDYPDEKIELVKYIYMDNIGGPKDAASFSWYRDYGGSGIFTDRDPYVKAFTSEYAMDRQRVKSFNDFTPGRMYFSPNLLYYDTDYVLISVKATAASDAPASVQCMNATDASVVFTYPIPDKDSQIDDGNVIRTKKGFTLLDKRNDKIINLGFDGKLQSSYKYK